VTLPDRHTDAVHVLVGRGEAMAVIDDDGAAGIEEIALGQRHGAAGGSDDRRAARRRDIDTAMRRAGLAVEDALAAIDAGDRTGRRPMQRLLEERQVGVGGARARDHRALALDALERDRIGRYLLLGQPVDALHIVVSRLNREIAMLAAAIGEGDFERGVIGRVAAEAEDEPAIGRDAHGAAVEHHLRAGIGLAAHQTALLDGAIEGQRSRPRRSGDQRDQDCYCGTSHSSDP